MNPSPCAEFGAFAKKNLKNILTRQLRQVCPSVRVKITLKERSFECAGAMTPYRQLNRNRRFERAWWVKGVVFW